MAHMKTTWHHVRRSPYQALAAILIMMVTFFAVSVFTFLILGSTKIINYFESKPQVTAFFKDEAKQQDIDALKTQIQSTGKIASTKFVSKQDALKIYKEQNRNYAFVGRYKNIYQYAVFTRGYVLRDSRSVLRMASCFSKSIVYYTISHVVSSRYTNFTGPFTLSFRIICCRIFACSISGNIFQLASSFPLLKITF